jgi:uncharacterized protein YecT (DUF1311 family)
MNGFWKRCVPLLFGAALTVFPLLAAPAGAECDPDESCECAHAQEEAADARLNAVYRELRAFLSSERKQALTAMQKQWLEFRDAACAYQSGYWRPEAEGRHTRNWVLAGCQGQRTLEQVKFLERLKCLNKPEPGDCPIQEAPYADPDAELNRVYNEYRAGLDAEPKKALTAMQRRWLKFRDAACLFEANDGPSPMNWAAWARDKCLDARTGDQVGFLKRLPSQTFTLSRRKP